MTTSVLTLAVATVFAGATLGSRFFFETPSAEEQQILPLRPVVAPSGQTLSPEQLFMVAALEGSVETMHDGKWYAVQAGDRLSLQDVVRTPPGGRAILRRGSTEIEIREKVDVRLAQVAERTARFDVLRGRVSARVDDQQDRLEIGARGALSTSEGKARWVVALDPRGDVFVATESGSVAVEAEGKTVRVPARHESRVVAGQAPTPPEPLPEDLLLSVFWPEGPSTGRIEAVKGAAKPSTRILVNGESVEVGADGTWKHQVDLRIGRNPVHVEATDLLGKKKDVSGSVIREAPTPTLEVQKTELWRK